MTGSPTPCTPFISFIIPVYNAQHDLPATLSSILQQDDGTIEVICIDDGSSDKSGIILDAYAREHPCMVVQHQHNQGITAARNAGLSNARGTWVCFVDNDDILAKTAVSVIHDTAENDCDIIYYGFQRFSSPLPEQHTTAIGGKTILESKDISKLQSDCINRFHGNKPHISHSILPTPWAKIYRRDFLCQHHLLFRNDVTHEEDIVFNFEVLSYVHRVKIVDFTLYYYRWSTSSESHRYRPRIFQSSLTTLNAYRDIIKRRYPQRQDIIELYRYRVLWELQYCVFLGPMHEKNPASYKQRKRQFDILRDYPLFAESCNTLHMCKFEPRQSLLALLIKYRQFWLLNLLGKIVGKIR